MKWIAKLFGKKKAETGKAEQSAAPVQAGRQQTESVYLTQTVVFGMHQYRSAGEDSSVYFVDEARGIRKMLVDSLGRIQNFPGIADKDALAKTVSANALTPQIRFRTSFEKREDQWLMLWEVQPDGRYWEDEDGFGGTNDEEVTLCTYVDRNGSFTGPFEIYRIGIKKYHSVPKLCYPVSKATQLPAKFHGLLEKWQAELAQILESGKATWYAKSVSTTFIFRGVHYQLTLNDICDKALTEKYQHGICAAAFEILQRTIQEDLEAMGAEDVKNFGFLD